MIILQSLKVSDKYEHSKRALSGKCIDTYRLCTPFDHPKTSNHVENAQFQKKNKNQSWFKMTFSVYILFLTFILIQH